MMESPQKGIASLILLLGLFVVAHGRSRYKAEDVNVYINLDNQPMEDLLQRMRNILIDNKPRLTVAGHQYLATKDAKQGSPPCRWINVHLAAGGHRTTLAFDDSAIYLHAFKNTTNHWNCFSNINTLFPGCTILPFQESYPSILGGEGHTLLTTVPLGKAAATRAAQLFSGYNPSTTPEADIKMATASLLVMIPEALRFKPIREVFTGQHWETETFVALEQAKLVVHWARASYALYLWMKNGAWPGRTYTEQLKKIKINNANDALSIVDLLKRPRELSIDSDIY